MRQIIQLLVTLETPHTDEALNDADRERNCDDARDEVLAALMAAGFSVTAIEVRR